MLSRRKLALGAISVFNAAAVLIVRAKGLALLCLAQTLLRG